VAPRVLCRRRQGVVSSVRKRASASAHQTTAEQGHVITGDYGRADREDSVLSGRFDSARLQSTYSAAMHAGNRAAAGCGPASAYLPCRRVACFHDIRRWGNQERHAAHKFGAASEHFVGRPAGGSRRATRRAGAALNYLHSLPKAELEDK